MNLRSIARALLCGGLLVGASSAGAGIPESPAFDFLDASPSTVSRPLTAHDLGVQLLQGVDSTGMAQSGLAIEATPWFLFPGARVSLEEYQSSGALRGWSNLRLSFATVQAAGLDGGTDMALGLGLPLIDRGDPLMDKGFVSGVRAALGELPGQFPPSASAREDSIARSSAFGQYWNEHVQRNQGRLRISLAGAAGLRLVDSRLNRSYGSGGAAWLTATGGLASWFLLTTRLKWQERRAIPGEEGSHFVEMGARADVPGQRTNLFLEWAPRWESPGTESAQGRWSGGVEFKISDELWAATGIGSSYGLESGADRVVVLANVRWALSSKAKLLRTSSSP